MRISLVTGSGDPSKWIFLTDNNNNNITKFKVKEWKLNEIWNGSHVWWSFHDK